ncbi:MAG TPA: dienelactone hydrolase family protein [Stellaceae bacterium]|jgi:carboxymethylenebutenolidase|nr:dienelactone hydrolase family protein [Stellaceae bacterium]
MPNVTINAADGGTFSAYLSLPKNVTAKTPGIVMMQQIFGANAEMRGFTDDYAAQGYVAICPDLFWRIEPGVEIDPLGPDGFQRAVNYAPRFDADRGVEDLKATVAFLRAHPACNGKIGTVGYCLGGLLAYLMAARSDADCNVGYFGVRIEKYLGEAGNVTRPLMLHIPEADRHVSPEAQAQTKAVLVGRAELCSYPGADHAFNRVGAKSYNQEVTALADDRTANFLRRHLLGR